MPRRGDRHDGRTRGSRHERSEAGKKKSGAPDRRRYIQVARETTSVGGALQETSDPFGNSEEVARLYTELVNSFGSNDSEAVRLIYRALLRLGRPRAEILAEVARVAAAQEATQTRSGSLGQAIAPTELESVAPTTAVHAQSRPRLLPASAGFRPALNSAKGSRSLLYTIRRRGRNSDIDKFANQCGCNLFCTQARSDGTFY